MPSPLGDRTTHLEEALLLEQGIPQTVSKPLLSRLNSKGVKVIQCPKRYAYGFGSISLDDEYLNVLDMGIGRNSYGS